MTTNVEYIFSFETKENMKVFCNKVEAILANNRHRLHSVHCSFTLHDGNFVFNGELYPNYVCLSAEYEDTMFKSKTIYTYAESELVNCKDPKELIPRERKLHLYEYEGLAMAQDQNLIIFEKILECFLDVIHGAEQDTIPEVIDWYAELEKRMPKDDPLFEKFKEFKLNVEEIRKQTFGIIPCKEKTPANYDWLHNLLEDTDGDIPNLKGLKDLFIAMIEYTSHYSDTGIKDYDRKMRKLYNIVGKALNIINFE